MAKASMFQAIQTKYLGPTNVRGSRVKASAECGSITLSWDNALNSEENHAKAAQALADKFGWKGPRYGRLIGGGLPGSGYVFVSVYDDDVCAFLKAFLETAQRLSDGERGGSVFGRISLLKDDAMSLLANLEG